MHPSIYQKVFGIKGGHHIIRYASSICQKDFGVKGGYDTISMHPSTYQSGNTGSRSWRQTRACRNETYDKHRFHPCCFFSIASMESVFGIVQVIIDCMLLTGTTIMMC